MSLEAVYRWRDALAADVAGRPDVGLSPEGLALVVDHALGALEDAALDAVVALPGRPFDHAAFVAARTVQTAPVEWLAVLLARGTRVLLKHPVDAPGLAPWLAAHATAVGLPLAVTDQRDAVMDAPLVVAMGGDPTIAALRDALPAHARLLGFGARWSAAWWPADADADVAAEALARDLAAHDGRGCMTPAIVLTDAPDTVLAVLPDALAEAERRWPRGRLSDAEHAASRQREALARAAGRAVAGDRWALHMLPAELARPVSLPRAAQVVKVEDAVQAAAVVRPWAAALSTLGLASDSGGDALAALEPSRICALGTMQTPPLRRLHDGVDAWRLTLR